MAARPDSAKAQALLLRYQNASSLVTIHLLAVICPIMTQFSMCLQTENFCHFDLPSIKQHYITKLQDIKSNPASHPLYWGCATAVNDACVGHAGFAPINLGFVKTRLRAKMLDTTLEDSFVINVEVDFTDLNGIQDKEVIKQVVSAFITGPDRKHSFAAYEGLQEAREWVAAWRQSFMDNL
eukprot:TRINITY_DN2954_c2_g1_i2.p3 TRINITY_DN2954_c2_g1~~TRINITY_DN2954_c2_g1_i2.p3  ORF type:complete len:181 (+),score=37.11 TRINITY_DN2954_c2_g1_i2:1159-1701(+)